MRYEDENIWLTQKMMAALYDVSVSAINQHLKTIFEDGELDKEAVIKKYLITAADGKQYNTNHYNLQAIIAVGFKVNNDRAVQFRKWANAIVKDYTIQGWAMDSDRLKNGGSVLTKEYFDHLLEQIREIRMSERRFPNVCLNLQPALYRPLWPFPLLGRFLFNTLLPCLFQETLSPFGICVGLDSVY